MSRLVDRLGSKPQWNRPSWRLHGLTMFRCIQVLRCLKRLSWEPEGWHVGKCEQNIDHQKSLISMAPHLNAFPWSQWTMIDHLPGAPESEWRSRSAKCDQFVEGKTRSNSLWVLPSCPEIQHNCIIQNHTVHVSVHIHSFCTSAELPYTPKESIQ